MTAPVSLIFIAMIPIDYKIYKFFLTLVLMPYSMTGFVKGSSAQIKLTDFNNTCL